MSNRNIGDKTRRRHGASRLLVRYGRFIVTNTLSWLKEVAEVLLHGPQFIYMGARPDKVQAGEKTGDEIRSEVERLSRYSACRVFPCRLSQEKMLHTMAPYRPRFPDPYQLLMPISKVHIKYCLIRRRLS